MLCDILGICCVRSLEGFKMAGFGNVSLLLIYFHFKVKYFIFSHITFLNDIRMRGYLSITEAKKDVRIKNKWLKWNLVFQGC